MLWVVSDDAKRRVNEVTEEHEMVASIVFFFFFFFFTLPKKRKDDRKGARQQWMVYVAPVEQVPDGVDTSIRSWLIA